MTDMDKMKLEKRAKRLFALWRVLLGLFSVGISVYMAYQQVFNGVDVTVIPNTFHFLLCAILAFVFAPILVLVRKWANEADADKLRTKATKWLAIFAISIVGTLIANILGFFIPGLFE